MFKFIIVLFVFAGTSSSEEFKLHTVTLGPAPATDGTARIIGGSATSIENYPYTVQVIYLNRLICGGSLLTRRHALSAAHCFVGENGNFIPANAFSIRAGTATSNSGGTLHTVSTIVIHERYSTALYDNDVAVLVLTSSVTLSSRVREAVLPAQGNAVPDNVPVWHVGWGVTNTGLPSSILQEVQVYTVNEAVCRSRYQYLQGVTGQLFPVTGNMICAGLLDIGGRDACQGDSGGPLVYQGIVVGVTSWGWGCADPTFPGVNAKVASYTSWINQTVVRYSAGCMSTPSYAVLLASLLVLILRTRNNVR